MADTINYRFTLRRGLSSSWTTKNELLLQGEFGLETDTRKVKIGDGTTLWNSLSYFTPGVGFTYDVSITSGNLTLSAAAHKNKLLLHTAGVVTVPETAASGFSVNDSLKVRKQTQDAVTFVPSGTAVLDYDNATYHAALGHKGDVVELKVIDVNTWALLGALDLIRLGLSGSYASYTTNVAYSSDLTISGGDSTYYLTGGTGIIAGSLPTGLSLSIVSVNRLRISGTTSYTGTIDVTVSVDSGDGQTVSSVQSITASTATFTWNPADKSVNINLSNGNLTATKANSASHDGSVRATFSKSAGKWYWEVHVDAIGANSAEEAGGIANASAPLSNFIGGTTDSWSYLSTNGYKYTGGTGTAYGTSYAAGVVIGVALDMDNGKVWFSLNGTWENSGNPAAGTNPAFTGLTGGIFPACGAYDVGAAFTARFAAAAQTYAAPSGFSAPG